MQLTEMGYYNAIMEVSDPDNITRLFEPASPGEKTGRLDDVETAISFINDRLDADAFADESNIVDGVDELMLKAYRLEKLRYNILREEWEPMFRPFPPNPVKYYDPDVVFHEKENGKGRFSAWVYLRTVPGEYAGSGDPIAIYIHDSYEEEDRDYNYWMENIGIEAKGDTLEGMLNEFLDKVKKRHGPTIHNELGEKFADLHKQFRMTFDTE